jgi:hypothetical protein
MDDPYAGDYKPRYDASWALVIGINDYQHARPLSYATQDAEDVAAALSDLGFPENGIRLLTDADACKARIEESYLDYIHVAGSPDDRIVVFFAGHGVTRSGHHGPVGYLVPVDGDPDQAASLIRLDEFTRNADLIPAKHILFIFDACFSGLALEEKRAAKPGAERFVSDMLQRRSRQAIAAGKGDQEVADGGGADGKNSIFTSYLIEALSGEAATGDVLTANGMMHYVYEKVAQDPAAEQTPHYGHIDGNGDLVLIAPSGSLVFGAETDALVPTVPLVPEEPAAPVERTPAFAEDNGYDKPDDPEFGRNTYSNMLGNMDYTSGHRESKALSWLAVVVEPVADSTVAVDISREAARFSDYSPEGSEPFERLLPPRHIKTTISSVLLFDRLSYDSEYWARYIRIDRAGSLEFCDSLLSYYSYEDMHAFRYVQTIGMVWQFLFFSKLMLGEYGYEHGARLLVNLVGTKDTILTDFASAAGSGNKKWLQPGEEDMMGRSRSLLDLKCPDVNLQMDFRVVPADLDEASSRVIIDSVAVQLGLAYNHQSKPRCYNYGTDTFPWKQFFEIQRHIRPG